MKILNPGPITKGKINKEEMSSKDKEEEIKYVKEYLLKKKRRSKEEAAEAREKELRDKLNLQAELKQMLYDLYMKHEITSKFSSEMRTEIDSGKMTEDKLNKLIKEHKKSFGKSDKEERGRSPSPEPTPKRGRPKKEKSPERSKSPEPKPKTKKKIDFNSMSAEQVKMMIKLKDKTTALQLNKGISDSLTKKLNKQIDNGTIDSVEEFDKVSKLLMEEEDKKPKEVKKTSGRTAKQYMDEKMKVEETNNKLKMDLRSYVYTLNVDDKISSDMSKQMISRINDDILKSKDEIKKFKKEYADIYKHESAKKEKEETPSSIIKTSKSLKDALKQPVKQLDIMTATVKAKLDAHDKVMIDTYLKLRKDLTAKEKKAVRLSIQNEINDKMNGSGLAHPMHIIYGYGINRTEDALEYFQHVKRLFGKI